MINWNNIVNGGGSMFGFFKKRSEEKQQLNIEEENRRREEEAQRKREEEEKRQQELKQRQEEEEQMRIEVEERKKKEQEEQIEHLFQGGILTTEIEGCEWLNSKNQFLKITVLLQDNSIFFKRIDNDSIVFDVESDSYFSDVVINSTDLEIDSFPKPISIGILIDDDYKGTFITYKNHNVEQMKNHFSTIEKIKEMKMADFSTKIKQKVLSLLENENITMLLTNYISRTNQNYFLVTDYYVSFEKILYSIEKIGKKTLACHPDQNNWPDNVEFEDVKSYYFETFSKLTKLLENKNCFDSAQEQNFVTWLLLRIIAVKYFHKVFQDEYGSSFNEMDENNSLNEYVENYCKIEMIDIESVTNASLLTYYYMKQINALDEDYLHYYEEIKRELLKAIKNKELNNFELSLMQATNKSKITINDIDMMDGHEFEHFVGSLIRKMGYSANVTKGSGDQGIDVIAEKDGRKFGIQTKCYGNAVTNKAIQEVVAGLSFYKLDKGIVVTNNYFTDSARELATSNGIILWDRNILKEKLSEFN
jgi:HJR/Mrr/RecB family endonuclease